MHEQSLIPQDSSRITLGQDGKYRWVYEYHLLKNPGIFLLVWKILFFISLAICAVSSLSDGLQWGWDHALEALRFWGWFLLGMSAVTALGYLVYAAAMGWRYAVAFELDEQGVLHRQVPAQARKARRLGELTAAAGLAAGRLSTVAAGRSAQRTEMYTRFDQVRRVKACPRQHTIKLSGLLEHNQVYAAKEDFDFVLHFILARCPRLKR